MVRAGKLYSNKEWLSWAYYENDMTPEEIASTTGAGVATIYRYLKQFGLIK